MGNSPLYHLNYHLKISCLLLLKIKTERIKSFLFNLFFLAGIYLNITVD